MSTETASDVPAAGSKVCFVCGIDLSGKPRRKDEQGRYWCLPCARGTEAQNTVKDKKAGRSQCPDCGQSLPTSVMIKVEDGLLVCEPCRNVREQERQKALARREESARGGEEERKQSSRLVYLLIVAGGLAVFTVYWNFMR
jgi:hypothetical protein